MNTATRLLSTLRRLSIVIAIAIVFVFGLGTTVYLSLRSPEVTVPEVVGKDRFEAERVLGAAGLNFRNRAFRPSSQVEADTVLFQLPRGGEVVKAGQTVAMDISRPVKEGEASETLVPEKSPEEKTANQNTNEADSANENKPRRNKNTNKNANDNANANSGNRNSNSNRPALIINNNANRSANQNANGRPPVVKPSPKPAHENP